MFVTELTVVDGIDAVMMLHPGNGDNSGGQVVRTLSMTHLRVTFKGSPAHAGLAPWEGVNALDAAVLAYTAIGVLRQQIQPSCRYVIALGMQDPANPQNPGNHHRWRLSAQR